MTSITETIAGGFSRIWRDQPDAVQRLRLARYTTGAAILRTVWHMPSGTVVAEQRELLESAGQEPSGFQLSPAQYEAVRGVALVSAAAWALGNDRPEVKITANLSFLALQRHQVAMHQDLYSYTSHLNTFLLLLCLVDAEAAGPDATHGRTPPDRLASAALAAMQSYYALVYLQSGISKLRVTGVKWLDGRTLRGSLAELGTPLGKRLSRQDLRLLAAAGTAAVGFELAFLPGLLAGWRHKQVFGLLSLGFHTSIKATMNISFWHFAWFALPLFVLPAETEQRIGAALKGFRRRLSGTPHRSGRLS
ncbi:hypothetical protein ABZ695_28225 [Streptomyces sp. NPDC006976]|uniref:hypothetical protein n=1 Tax=unclassified Streptomyces TaxID=2593676 RepID=UPI00037BC425|nr:MULTISPECIES: hypothetical protein [unclassified Streptomyces]MYY04509.1 hypothetical protein [Streptomyces sp. SID4913]